MSRKGHVPLRVCVGCRTRKKKVEMIRFHITAEGIARRTEGKHLTGRGIYLCPDERCFNLAKRRRQFELVGNAPLHLHRVKGMSHEGLSNRVKEERDVES